MNRTQEMTSQLVIASSNRTVLLNLGKEILDLMPCFI
ncbi:MAG: hypothetical protein ACI9ST_000660 [Psychrobacter glaciei]|jgi:hypothetical protein